MVYGIRYDEVGLRKGFNGATEYRYSGLGVELPFYGARIKGLR